MIHKELEAQIWTQTTLLMYQSNSQIIFTYQTYILINNKRGKVTIYLTKLSTRQKNKIQNYRAQDHRNKLRVTVTYIYLSQIHTYYI